WNEVTVMTTIARARTMQVITAVKADEADDLVSAGEPLPSRRAADLQPERDVLDDAPVRQQPEVLEDHRDARPPQLAQSSRVGRDDVLAIEEDASRRRLDE